MKVASCSFFGSYVTYISFLAEQDNFRCDNKYICIVRVERYIKSEQHKYRYGYVSIDIYVYMLKIYHKKI